MRNVAVIGLGYVGLPLAVELAKKMPVVGFDISLERTLQWYQQNKSWLHDIQL